MSEGSQVERKKGNAENYQLSMQGEQKYQPYQDQEQKGRFDKPTIPRIFAHRGASGVEVENSFAAFDRALQLGADGLETDCWVTKDQQIILFHDRSISTPLGRKISIPRANWRELEVLRLSNGESIPTLEQFFCRYGSMQTLQREPVQFSIDLQDSKVGYELGKLVDAFKLWDRVKICGTSYIKLKQMRDAFPKAQLVISQQEDQLIDHRDSDILDVKWRELHLTAWNLQAKEVTPERIQILNKAGIPYYIWDLHDVESLQRCKYAGMQWIYSNFPDLARRVFQQNGDGA